MGQRLVRLAAYHADECSHTAHCTEARIFPDALAVEVHVRVYDAGQDQKVPTIDSLPSLRQLLAMCPSRDNAAAPHADTSVDASAAVDHQSVFDEEVKHWCASLV